MALNIGQANDVATVVRGIAGIEHDEKAFMDALLRLRNQAALRLDVSPSHIAGGVAVNAGAVLLMDDHRSKPRDVGAGG